MHGTNVNINNNNNNNNNKHNVRKQHMQTMSSIWWDYILHHTSMPNTGKRTIRKETWRNVRSTTLLHMQGNRGTIRQWTPVWPCTEEINCDRKITIFWNQQVQTNRTVPNNETLHTSLLTPYVSRDPHLLLKPSLRMGEALASPIPTVHSYSYSYSSYGWAARSH